MTLKIVNKRARFNYQITESFEAGVSLTGSEVKAIRGGRIDLTSAYAKVIGGEIFLVGAIIDADKTQPSQKLLLHRAEIQSIKTKIKAKRLTLVPVKVYTKGPRIKLEIALAKSKKKYNKKDAIKARDIDRDTQRELRGSKGNEDRRE